MSYIKSLKETLKINQQALLEVRHAFDAGPQWYTKGESGMRNQVRLWLIKAEAANAALREKGLP
jgi:hypothetical protein